MKPKGPTMINTENIPNYMHYIELPLKMVACWEWYPKPKKQRQYITNNVYLCWILFTISKIALGLAVNLYTEWEDIMSSLDKIADSLPLVVSLAIISHYAIYRQELYDLMEYMNKNFKFHSARGLTNMTMMQSYNTAKKFARIYTACTMFSVTMYVTLPVIVHWWTKEPLQNWVYMDVTRAPYLQLVFLHFLLAQWYVGLAVGQFGVFFATNSILICGQLDLLCCSLRNVRFTALLKKGVQHRALMASHADIRLDERHSYVYSEAVMKDSNYHYDNIAVNNFTDAKLKFDIYDSDYGDATVSALRDCARLCQVIKTYKDKFEDFVSPLLVLRVVQVTLYLCMLLYTATLKFDMITVEYLVAVSLDIFVYCYYGNQIILQANRVSTAAYQSAWHTMGARPRRMLLILLLSNYRPVVVRAGRFLPMDLRTFLGAQYVTYKYIK